ncbi:N-acetyltransferase family protein [Crenobacter sp. SG2303]|uniref:N-acetyltransferase family protein n=1 Tax=Crenobacter oryzisoli TaxID=3056844 RepID=A0ABT7XL31_9NEIS|nr:GNAT family N-acetyltransferase [Crenobacter sp. SG2303]MDN0074485.1 N-acetyltransferase family protein [Crenobacter sp. SG2303]
MDSTFRLATAADLPAIVAIYNSTIPSRQVTADLEPVSVESRQDWFDAHQTPRRPLWVLEQDGEVLGWASLSDFYGRPAYQGTAELSVYLREDCRGRGLGRRLLDEALERAPALGIDTLLGFIFGHNLPSLTLFERYGFSRWGTLPAVAELDGVKRDLIIVGRRV